MDQCVFYWFSENMAFADFVCFSLHYYLIPLQCLILFHLLFPCKKLFLDKLHTFIYESIYLFVCLLFFTIYSLNIISQLAFPLFQAFLLLFPCFLSPHSTAFNFVFLSPFFLLHFYCFFVLLSPFSYPFFSFFPPFYLLSFFFSFSIFPSIHLPIHSYNSPYYFINFFVFQTQEDVAISIVDGMLENIRIGMEV